MDQDEQAIRKVQLAWFEATTNGDLVRLQTLMADDVVFLVAGRPPFGREEFVADFKSGLQQARIHCQGEFEEVVVVGDTAYARGRLSVSLTPVAGGDPKRLAGYTLSIFRRQPDGHWVLARDANLLSAATVPDQE